MINFSEAYRKKMWSVIWKSLLLMLMFVASFTASLILFVSRNNVWGTTYAVVCIVSIIGFIWLFKNDGRELKEMYKKEEEESIYETELIKEKARLQAQKEFNQHKKK